MPTAPSPDRPPRCSRATAPASSGCCSTTRCASTASNTSSDHDLPLTGVPRVDLFDAIYGLRATRVYEDRDLAPDVLARILEAATRACSSGNTQPWELVVVVDRE